MTARSGDPHLITAAEFAKVSLPEVPKDIIGDGQIAVIAAQFGRGKTPLLAHIALEAACSVPLTPLGLAGCRSPVMIFDAESGASSYRAMFSRLASAAGIERWPETLQFWFKLDPSITSGTTSYDAVSRLVTERQPGLIVLDPLRQFASGYDLTDARQAMNYLDTLRVLQKSASKLRIVLSHHLTKRDNRREPIALADDPWAWLERVSGSLALMDHVDVRLGFEEENGKLVLAGIKRGVGIVGPWHFTVEENPPGEPCRYRFEEREHSVRARYVAFLEKLPDCYTWQAGRIILGIAESTMHRFTAAVKDAGLVVQGTDKSYRKVEVRKETHKS